MSVQILHAFLDSVPFLHSRESLFGKNAWHGYCSYNGNSQNKVRKDPIERERIMMRKNLVKAGLMAAGCLCMVVFAAQAQSQQKDRARGQDRTRLFVDANNDGVCDNTGKAQKLGSKAGQGLRSGQGQGMNGSCGALGAGLCSNEGEFVDADGDGVCDNRAMKEKGASFIDENGDGVCDNRGAASGSCQRQSMDFVDENGDGICDNRANRSGACQRQCGSLVDENGDGVCDNRPAGRRGAQGGPWQGRGRSIRQGAPTR